MAPFFDVAALLSLSLSPAAALVIHSDAQRWLPLHGVRNHDRWAFTNIELVDYLDMGPRDYRRLKKKFANSTVIQQVVNETCGPPQPDIDLDGTWNCDWQELDTLLCEATLKAGRMGMLGDVDQFRAAMINATADMEFAEAVGPSWQGEYRLREPTAMYAQEFGQNRFDAMTAELKQNAYTIFDEDTIKGLEDICATARNANTTCRANTLQHVVCQKAEKAALQLFAGSIGIKMVPILEKAVLPTANADQILRSGEGLRARSQEIFAVGSQITQQVWLDQGPNSTRQLKTRFMTLPGLHPVVHEACNESRETDCQFKYTESLLCSMLERYEPNDPTGELVEKLEGYIHKNLKSNGTDGDDGVDWSFRTAMIAKWRTSMGLRPAGGPIGEMKERISASPDFESMMIPICWDVVYNRPGCFEAAQQQFFCQSLTQAYAAVSKQNVDEFFHWASVQLPCWKAELASGLGANYLRNWGYDPDPCSPEGSRYNASLDASPA